MKDKNLHVEKHVKNPRWNLIILFGINFHFIFIFSGINLLCCSLIHSKKIFLKKTYYYSYQLENPNIYSLSHFPQEAKLQNVLSESLKKSNKLNVTK